MYVRHVRMVVRCSLFSDIMSFTVFTFPWLTSAENKQLCAQESTAAPDWAAVKRQNDERATQNGFIVTWNCNLDTFSPALPSILLQREFRSRK